MSKNDKDDYKVCFGGTTISKLEANKVGLSLIIGSGGVFLIYLVFGIQNKIIIFPVALVWASFGYFVVANKVFKESTKIHTMSLKPDEKFVTNCLVNALNATKAWEGEDPPDIYLEVNSEKIAVEITRLTPVSFGEDGTIQNRHSQDYFGLNLCDELNSSLRNEIPPEIDILLTLYVPVGNGRKYKKELYAYVRDFISKGIKTGDKEEIELSGSKVRISVIPNRDHSEKKIVGAIVNKNSSAHILSNAQATLADRIQEKIKKCKEIKQQGPIWLALFNDYWLADQETYAQALNILDIAHYFERIYVIMDTGTVHQIY